MEGTFATGRREINVPFGRGAILAWLPASERSPKKPDLEEII
jgi:hypothetical protein